VQEACCGGKVVVAPESKRGRESDQRKEEQVRKGKERKGKERKGKEPHSHLCLSEDPCVGKLNF
jgi:hypothetical protein